MSCKLISAARKHASDSVVSGCSCLRERVHKCDDDKCLINKKRARKYPHLDASKI